MKIRKNSIILLLIGIVLLVLILPIDWFLKYLFILPRPLAGVVVWSIGMFGLACLYFYFKRK